MALQTLIKINSIDVTSKLINYEIENTWGEAVTTGKCEFVNSVNDLLNINVGLTVEVWRGWITSTDLKIFSGYIESFNPENGKIEITIKDKLWDAIRKEVNKIYDYTVDASAGKISEIFKDLISTYAGLTVDGTTVQDSGDVVIIEKFVCNHTDIFERCQKLASILDWQFYYRADTDKVYFEPQGLTSNSAIIQTGQNVIGLPKWTYDTTEMVNDLTITGAYQEIETTESGRIGTTTGYTNSGIDILFTPISVKVYGGVSNPPTTLKTGGLPDSTTTFDYYVDKNNKKILPKNGTTFTTNDYYEIRYSHAVPIPVHLYDQPSIDSYKEFTKTINYDDLKNVADAETRARNYLSKYSKPFIYTDLKLKNNSTYDIKVGDNINVIDEISKPELNGNFVVTVHTMRYPNDYEGFLVGDKPFRLASWQSSIEEKLKRIDEQNIENQDLLTEVINIDDTINNQYNEIPRYFKANTQTVGGTDLFILGHTDYGILGTGQLGDTDMGAEILNTVIQFENVYIEKFKDTDFKDTGTGTWSTILQHLTFTNAQTMQSYSIDYNNGTITIATLTADNSTNVTFYLSADGGTHWETVTSGVSHTFTHSGTDLRWKIIASGVATVNSIVIWNYH